LRRAEARKRTLLDIADMPIEGLQDLGGKLIQLPFSPLGMEVDAPIGQVLDETGDVETAGNSKDLGTETDPLDMARIPDFPMGDMG
jgi:hypothetical protein